MATPRGFGTPAFDQDGAPHQVRVDGTDLVHRAGARSAGPCWPSIRPRPLACARARPDRPPCSGHRVLAEAELPEGRVTTVAAGHKSVALVHFFSALDNHCPHEGGPR